MNVVDKQCIEFIKGIAIVLMVAHHAYGFPYYYVDEFSHLDYGYFVYIADKIFKICVPVYAFLTSYLFYLHEDKSIKYVSYKIALLFISWWIALIFMLFCVYVTGDFKLSVVEILNETFVIDEKLGRFSWYVWFYAACMLILYVVAKIVNLFKRAQDLVSFITFAFIIAFSKVTGTGELWEYTWMPAVMMGWYAARFNCINVFLSSQAIKRAHNVWLGIVGILFSLCLWHILSYVPIYAVRMIAVAPFALFCVMTSKTAYPVLIKLFATLGSYGLYLWFLHALFFSVVTRDAWQPLLYRYFEPWFVVPVIIIICFPFSMLLSTLQRWVNKYLKALFL